MSCALLLLAAGASSRWGKPKALLPWGEGERSTLVAHLAAVALDSGCAPVVRVLGAHALDVARAVMPDGVVDAFNPGWREGMGSSIGCGLRRALQEAPDLAAVIVLPCDQPLVTPAVLAELRAALLDHPEALAVCDYQNGAHGPPAGFGRAYFSELLALGGDEGGRQILRRHAARRRLVAFSDGRWDLDCAADLLRFQNRANKLTAFPVSESPLFRS